jgi:hypothetical protein
MVGLHVAVLQSVCGRCAGLTGVEVRVCGVGVLGSRPYTPFVTKRGETKLSQILRLSNSSYTCAVVSVQSSPNAGEECTHTTAHI